MGQKFSQINDFKQSNTKPKKSIECLQDVDFLCPNTLLIELHEISICSDFRRMSNTWKIKEFYIPQFNIGINNQHNGKKSYNLIIDAYSRYYNDNPNTNNIRKYGDPPKLIKSFFINFSESEELGKLFNTIKCYIISQNAEQTINKLFELTDELDENDQTEQASQTN